jgi:hypothetical protein
MTKIRMKINNKGEIKARYIGFAGKNCDLAERKLKQIIGDAMKIKTKHQEYDDKGLEKEHRHA